MEGSKSTTPTAQDVCVREGVNEGDHRSVCLCEINVGVCVCTDVSQISSQLLISVYIFILPRVPRSYRPFCLSVSAPAICPFLTDLSFNLHSPSVHHFCPLLECILMQFYPLVHEAAGIVFKHLFFGFNQL